MITEVNILNKKNIKLLEEERLFVDTTYFESVDLITLETNENSLIRSISKIMYIEDKFFIFDKSLFTVFIFDLTGKHINTIQRVGNGPGEYTGLLNVCLDTINRHIILYSDAPHKFLFFDYSGNFIKEKAINDLYKEIVCDGTNIYSTNYVPNLQNNYCYLYSVELDNFNNKCVYTIPTFPDCDFYIGGNYLTNVDKILFTHRFDNSIYEIGGENVKIKYDIDFGKYNLPDKYRKKGIELKELEEISNSKKYIYSIVEMSEHNNYFCFNTNITGLFLYDKKADILKKYSFVYDSKYDFYYSKMFSIENKANSIAFVVNMDNLFRLKDDRVGTDISSMKGFFELMDRLEPDDNPLLMLCTFK